MNCKHKHLLNSDSSPEINQYEAFPLTLNRLESCERTAAERLSTMAKKWINYSKIWVRRNWHSKDPGRPDSPLSI